MHKTIVIFQKSCGFLKWEQTSSNAYRLITLKQYQEALGRLDVLTEQKSRYFSFKSCRAA